MLIEDDDYGRYVMVECVCKCDMKQLKTVDKNMKKAKKVKMMMMVMKVIKAKKVKMMMKVIKAKKVKMMIHLRPPLVVAPHPATSTLPPRLQNISLNYLSVFFGYLATTADNLNYSNQNKVYCNVKVVMLLSL